MDSASVDEDDEVEDDEMCVWYAPGMEEEDEDDDIGIDIDMTIPDDTNDDVDDPAGGVCMVGWW